MNVYEEQAAQAGVLVDGPVIGIVNADMFGTPSEPGEHVDWSLPDYFTAEEWVKVLTEPVEDFAATATHMIVFEVTP